MEHLTSFVREAMHDNHVIFRNWFRFKAEEFNFSRLRPKQAPKDEVDSTPEPADALLGMPAIFATDDQPRDYTTERAQMVLGRANGRSGACLALDFILSRDIQHLIYLNKHYEVKEEQGQKLASEKNSIEAEITRIQVRLRALEKQTVPRSRVTELENQSKRASLELQNERLQQDRHDICVKMGDLCTEMENVEVTLDEVQDRVNKALEDVFVRCGLVDYKTYLPESPGSGGQAVSEPPEIHNTTLSERDPVTSRVHSSGSSETISLVKEIHEGHRVESEPEEGVRWKYRQAWKNWQEADYDHVVHTQRYLHDLASYCDKEIHEPIHELKMKFDFKYLQESKELSSRVARADEELRKVLSEALEEQIAFTDLESGIFTGQDFHGYGYGYSMSEADEWDPSPNVDESVREWMSLNTKAGLRKLQKGDPWDLTRPQLREFDSISCYARSEKNRRMIAVWANKMNRMHSRLSSVKKGSKSWVFVKHGVQNKPGLTKFHRSKREEDVTAQ